MIAIFLSASSRTPSLRCLILILFARRCTCNAPLVVHLPFSSMAPANPMLSSDDVALVSYSDSKSRNVDAKLQQEVPRNPLLPFNYPLSRKWLITLTAGLNTLLFGLNATAFTVVTDTIAGLYNISDETFPNSYWPVTSWNMGAAVGTILILPLMENFGTRYFYLVFIPPCYE